MLLYVLESKGSSPGRQGFFMAVNIDGEMEGSIGGGIMEHKFVELAKEKLQSPEQLRKIRKQVHDKTVAQNQSGMICSGEQTNLLYRFIEHNIAAVEDLIECLSRNRNGLLQLSNTGFQFTRDIEQSHNFLFEYHSNEHWLYTEKIGYKHILHIVGGGHCALAFSKIMSMMDFYIHLYDNRDGLNTMSRNEFVHEKHELNDYSELSRFIFPGNDHFVVIMTFGYRTDMGAVKTLLDKEFCYLGLLGSRKKIKKLLVDLKKEGFSQQQLGILHAPVGFPINSQTPEEIAISIAAEIIQVKNTQPGAILNPELKKSLND